MTRTLVTALAVLAAPVALAGQLALTTADPEPDPKSTLALSPLVDPTTLPDVASNGTVVTLATPDEALLRQIHESNLVAIRVGDIAAEKGESAKVRQFGQQLEKEHAVADQLIFKEASRLGIDLSSVMSAANQVAVEQLRDEGAADFDRTFLEKVETQLEAVIAQIDVAPKNDAGVQALCQKLLTRLRRQQTTATRLQLRLAKA